ncbi:uncharacterized protein [Drosophila kikkawai]|uniref:F-box domain-containing protein n=1 Tax=Drosophila kikkawai TaxID=30033 RepID=A0A6P4ICZ7_DROKI|nr:uncharacterized protein LOC108077337 [Drosophila kikkawai]
MTSISSLNEDCLLQIVEYLGLEEQLELWQATESTSRLCSVISYAWQRQSKHCVRRETFSGRPVLQRDFLQCISSTVTELTLRYLPMEQLEQWKAHTFPNVRELYYLGDEYDEADGDADIAIMVSCFPQLESVGISGNTSGQHISQWRHLRRLDLQLCWYLGLQCFEDICQKLRLQTLTVQWRRAEEDVYVQAISALEDLEELDLDIVHLSPENARKLLSLPKLAKFRLHNMDLFDSVLEDIARLRGPDLVGITCRDNFVRWSPRVLANLVNLRRLTLVDDEGSCAIDFSVIIKSFPHLEQLNLENSRIWPNADGIWDVVAACPQLEVITVFNQCLSEDFFAFSASTMQRALDKRIEPLAIRFLGTGNEELIAQHFVHRNLKVFHKATDYTISQVPEECMEFEFLILDKS